ncbi:MAG: hypothetical protein WD648_10935 [Planctomycetaceae bacterium]
MLTITPTAYARLSKQLVDRPDDVAVRIILREGRVKFRRGRHRTGDTVFNHEGRPVLLVGQRTAKKIGNRTLDALETVDGQRLRLRRPK